MKQPEKDDTPQQGAAADQEEEIAEAVELSYGLRMLRATREAAPALERAKSAEATTASDLENGGEREDGEPAERPA